MNSLPFSRPAAALRRWLVCASLILLATTGRPSSAWAAAPDKEVERGQALARAIRGVRPAQATASKGTLRMRTPDGRRTAVPIEVRVELGSNTWSTVYQANFPDGRRETLTVVKPDEAPPHFVLHRAGGDGNVTEIRPQRPDEMFAPFAGTDFWFVDLGMMFLNWPEQRWIGREIRRTRSCNMLESRNPLPAPGAYTRVVTWVDDDTQGIVRAEAYDAQNRLLKEFSPGSFARVGARYELREMEIRNDQTDSRTILEFEVDDPEKLGMKHLPTK